ncbi:hypothetical protein [Pararobbsia alpina]|uniref:Uncharacterized protein n=1 Tax=Pararobbsia alpina TaxID=621374 RepID=A0A6S7BJV4_9BURK|nr:hypothetical protein [Pararobbsia alpina]CAB3802927.1 hypothetical protein LMG28138_05266 [Pararobbsia alpina]
MRVDVITMRLSGGAVPKTDAGPRATTAGELAIDTEEIAGLGAQVTVARLRTDGTTQACELLPALMDAKLTELADDTFVLTGVELQGPSRFAQAWYCKVHL